MTAPDQPTETAGERLVRIETKLDLFLTGHADHESRIRRLERALWLAAGAGMVGGGGFSAVINQLMGG